MILDFIFGRKEQRHIYVCEICNDAADWDGGMYVWAPFKETDTHRYAEVKYACRDCIKTHDCELLDYESQKEWRQKWRT